MIKKNYFGDDHEIMYGCVINHDAYAFLKITLEVPSGQDKESIVFFNNKEVGKIVVEKSDKETYGYIPFRKVEGEFIRHTPNGTVRELGRAVSSIISDLI